MEALIYIFAGLLIIFMTIGMTLYSAGMVQAKNTVSIILKNLVGLGIASLIYLCFTHNLIYGSHECLCPLSDFLYRMLAGMLRFSLPVNTQSTHLAEIFNQLFIVGITLSIIAGASAGRLKLGAFIIFSILLSLIVMPVLWSWHWGGGFLHQAGFIDHAGAGMIYLTGSVASLIAVILLGPRAGKYIASGGLVPLRASNIPLATTGALLFWLGSLGFNLGLHAGFAQLPTSAVLVTVILNSCTAAMAGMLTTTLISRIVYGSFDITLSLNGLFIGVVSMAAAAATANTQTTILISILAGALLLIAIHLTDKTRLDDPTGALTIYGLGSILSLLSVVFTQDYAQLSAQKHMSWTWGNQLLAQLYGIASIILFVLVLSLSFWLLIRVILGIRINPEDEHKGLDLVDCQMTAYPEFTFISKE